MRILFISTGGVGHVFPMVPLAWALRAAGNEVLIATASQAMAAEQAGLAVVNVAEGFTPDKRFAELRRTDPELFARIAGRRSWQMTDLRVAVEFLAMVSEPMVDDAVATAESWQPDLLVQSQVDGAGLVVAGKLGLPLVNHGFGIARTFGFAALLREGLADAFARHGVTGAPRPNAYLDVAPASLLEEPTQGWPIRHCSYNGGGRLEPWMTEVGARPRIAVTLGTVVINRAGFGPLDPVLACAEHVDAEFIVTLGDQIDNAERPEVPDNVRLVGWVPLNLLLPSCSALIHHGGAGSTFAALDAGIPQIVLPSGADRYINGAAVHRRGAGLSLPDTPMTPETIQRVLTDESMAKAAAAVRDEIRAMPTPATLVPRLEALATNHPR